MELGLAVFFGGVAAWFFFTTPKFRETVWGYVILIAIIGVIISLLTGQGPGSHYMP